MLCLFNNVGVVCFCDKAQNSPLRFFRGELRQVGVLKHSGRVHSNYHTDVHKC